MKPYSRPPFRLALSDLDCERFGIRTAVAYYPLPEDLKSIRPFCVKQDVTLCLARCFAEEMETFQQLVQQGFVLMDTSVHWTQDLGSEGAHGSVPGVQMMRPGEEETIYQIARDAFKRYRSHYFNDSKLSRSASEKVYSDWARREAGNSGETHAVFVVESGDRPAGFITLTVENKTQTRIVLVAVSPAFQHQGLVQRLLLQAGDWARTRHCSQLTITTQLTNIAAQKACQRVGFAPISVFLYLACLVQMRIPFNKPSLAGKELVYIRDAIRRGQLSGDGYYSQRCSRFLEEKLGMPAVLLNSSCTHALELAYLILNLEPGDEVILPSFTFPSTANAFVLRGAIPRFVDIRRDTLNLDERLLASACNRRTRAISPVHYAGVPCEMAPIMSLARRRRIRVVEDAAQALGASYRGRPAGTFGDLNAFSFHETKNCICGEGGALVVKNATFLQRAKIIRQKGTNRDAFFRGVVDKYSWVDVGSSYLMSDLQAAYLYAQLEHMNPIRLKRKRLYDRYVEAFAGERAKGRLQLPVIPDHVSSSYHLFYVICANTKERQRMEENMQRQGILALTHYFPLHLSRMGRRYGYGRGDFPVTEDIAPRLLRLPLYNTMTRFEQNKVIAALHKGLHASASK